VSSDDTWSQVSLSRKATIPKDLVLASCWQLPWGRGKFVGLRSWAAVGFSELTHCLESFLASFASEKRQRISHPATLNRSETKIKKKD